MNSHRCQFARVDTRHLNYKCRRESLGGPIATTEQGNRIGRYEAGGNRCQRNIFIHGVSRRFNGRSTRAKVLRRRLSPDMRKRLRRGANDAPYYHTSDARVDR